MTLKALVVDDASMFRRAITEALNKIPDVQVVGSAATGKLALQRIAELEPDVMTLDIDMPGMDGLEVLDALREQGRDVGVIVVSALTPTGGRMTIRALEKGAFDFILKPTTSGAEESLEAIYRELLPRIRALGHRRSISRILRTPQPAATATVPADAQSLLAPGAPRLAPIAKPSATPLAVEAITQRAQRITHRQNIRLLVIGVSTGGPNALAQLIPALPPDLGVPVLIVQHMPPVFTQSLAESLSQRSKIPVREAQHGEPLRDNVVYLAPGGRQMRIAPGDNGATLVKITDDPPENNCRPSVDYLFRSVARDFPARVVAAILTGMGSDGAAGVRLLKQQGARIVAQDEASCVVFGMPKAAIETGAVDDVVTLDEMAQTLVTAVRGRGA